MFGYELLEAHRMELQRRADAWRLAREAKAARTAERRADAGARRTQSRTAARTDAEGAPSSQGAAPSPLGRTLLAHRPRRAA
jgi:hypothetical protein